MACINPDRNEKEYEKTNISKRDYRKHYEVHQFKHSNKSKIIYGILLISLIAALVSLPFIKITIYNTSQGLIRPDKERILLQSSHSGKVIFHQLKNNLQVKKGDTLYSIASNYSKNREYCKSVK